MSGEGARVEGGSMGRPRVETSEVGARQQRRGVARHRVAGRRTHDILSPKVLCANNIFCHHSQIYLCSFNIFHSEIFVLDANIFVKLSQIILDALLIFLWRTDIYFHIYHYSNIVTAAPSLSHHGLGRSLGGIVWLVITGVGSRVEKKLVLSQNLK